MSQRRIFRRFILPSAWLLIGVLVAVSLVKLAFTGSSSAAEDQLYPTGEVPAETIMVETGTVENTLSISGSIKLDAAQPLNAPLDGVVNWAFVKPGDHVSKGDRIFQIRAETQPEAAETTESDQESSTEEEPVQAAEPVVTYHDVYAPATGKVGKFAIELDDEVTKGADLAKVQPQHFKAVGAISPLDRYRLMDGTLEATITIEGGPEPFTCKDLSVGDTASATVDADSPEQELDPGMGPISAEGQGSSASGSEISCDVPAETVVFDGLSMAMDIEAGTAEEVLTVPVTAVRGLVGSGAVWLLDENGKEIRTEVQLGVTDGKVVEVASGLEAGAEVLRYVPGSAPEPAEGPGMEMYP
ncbi:efflux RND transporter periplasmic adaptor subunit [Glutamicibacter sp. AOP12-B1-11]|uniref:efflux RND transporter periplasmic adaptor subunit n=1 Tax=Glutamicibacter sp. AOP12-B1-11 TaxID=3457725 RepID=UPI0040343DC7